MAARSDRTAEAGSFALLRRILGSQSEIALSDGEFEEFRIAHETLMLALALEEKYELVVGNFQELERTLNDIALEHMLRSEYRYDQMNDLRVLINLRVVNLLTATRLYLDHGAHHVSDLLKLWPTVVCDFAALTRDHHSTDVNYRIADALRNYTQHRAFPIRSMSVGGTRVDRPTGNQIIQFYVNAYVDVDGMRFDGKVNQQVMADLEASGSKLDARPILRGYAAALSQIQKEVRDTFADVLQPSKRKIREAISRYQQEFPTEASIAGLAAVSRDRDGRHTKVVQIFVEPIDRLERFVRQNRDMQWLPNWHVSSEPTP